MYSPNDFTVGSEWRTREGHKAIILNNCYEICKKQGVTPPFPIDALVFKDDAKLILTYTENGGYGYPVEHHPADLIEPWPGREPVKVTQWAVVSTAGIVKRVCSTEFEAGSFIRGLSDHVIIKLTGTEGEE